MKDEKENDLVERTTVFGLRIVKMFVALPQTEEARVLGKQVLRSGTSVGANYPEAAFSSSFKPHPSSFPLLTTISKKSKR